MSDVNAGPIGHEPEDGDHGLAGVYFAIVTQNKDEDGKAGRVKVRYPWMPGGDEDQSFWAPICVPMCGNEFGTFTLPEVEDCVLVVFIAGDIRYPIVIGGAWSKTDEPPEINEDGKNDFRFIKSRSGHRLLFDDSSSAKLVLTDKGNENVLACGPHAEGGASDQNKFGVDSPPDIKGDAGKGVALGSLKGTLNILCPSGTLTVEAKAIEVQAKSDLEIKADGDIELKGSSMGSMASTAVSKYEGSQTKIN